MFFVFISLLGILLVKFDDNLQEKSQLDTDNSQSSIIKESVSYQDRSSIKSNNNALIGSR